MCNCAYWYNEKCNNFEYEKLVKDAEEFAKLWEQSEVKNLKLERKNKQLRDMLKRCSPFEVDDHGSYETEWCAFCQNEREIGHSKSCEYVQYIKE